MEHLPGLRIAREQGFAERSQTSMNFQSVEEGFERATADGVFPGAVLLIGRGEEVLYEKAFGARSSVPARSPMQVSTVFDVASLTKPLATATAVMLLVRERKIRLDDQVTRFLPTFGVFGKSLTTVRHLLNHSSGLPSWKPFYQDVVSQQRNGRINFVGSGAAKSYVFEQIHREKPLNPPGTHALYSDLGFMVLGEIIEVVSGAKLDRFCQDHIFKSLGLRSTTFVDLTQLRARRLQPPVQMTAPTEKCPWRKKILCAEVHDDNAYAMGGVAGHAGLFSSARDIHAIVACLNRCLQGKDSFVPQPVVEEFFTRDPRLADSTHALGWDTPSPGKSAGGRQLSARSVGHLGFTGTSIWWDLEKDRHIILLTNRVHPNRNNEKIKEFRPVIHDLIIDAVRP